jgi:hypothetical protein
MGTKWSARGTIRILFGTATALAIAVPVRAQDVVLGPDDARIGGREYSPYLAHYPDQVYFGDTHLHTSFSTDAGMVGNRLDPDDAYAFAKGEEVTSSNGTRARLQRPLDFLVVADHAENIGLATMIDESNPDLLRTEFGRLVHGLVKSGQGVQAYNEWITRMNALDDPLPDRVLQTTMWERLTAAAERNNDPGVFTAFIGYEWTAMPGGNNLHRNVIFRDGSDRANRIVPMSQYDSTDPEDLWEWMQTYEELTGGQVLAIPHNGNLSNGLMFDDVTLTSREPIDADYAERRQLWEPIYEVTQMKGDGEAHPFLSPDDEFADFETWDKGSFGTQPKTPDMLAREYARTALVRGLAYEAQLGVNPFKFGMVGSTDAHTSLATTQENNFFGKVSVLEPSADPIRMEEVIAGRFGADDGSDIRQYAWQTSASGLAAVWATGNTREELWDAMARKEVFATTGTRIRVRVFAGWDFTPEEVNLPDFAAQGYTRGVPMGGDLTAAPEGVAPRFLVRALRDPDGANLDRIQIVKGWVAEDGAPVDRVYDVALSDDRAAGAGGTVPPVGNTVDAATATYTNTIGDAALGGFWEDPDFDPAQRAVYYVRVLEIPTPRWTTYDAVFFGVDIPEGAPISIQERAYTSPIWYSPR